MATTPYTLSKPMSDSAPFRSLLNSVSALAINAESSADAKAFAKAQSGSDVDVTWDNATATQVAASGDMTGWSFRLRIVNPEDAMSDPSAIIFDETVLGGDTVAVKALATLTNDGGGDASDAQTFIVGTKTYTLQSSLTNVDGHIKIGASVTATLANILHAINASGGTPGTDYAAAMTANADVDGLTSDATHCNLRAKVAGAGGNAIVSTEGLTHYTFGETTFAGGESADEVSTFANAMVTALNATSLIAGAAYNASTHVLTVAETTDSLGDHRIFGYWIAPNADSSKLIGVPGFIASQVDGGSAGDALTMTLVADTYTVPTVIGLFGPQVV